MECKSRIRDVESRADAINLTLHGLCATAGVVHTTILKWRDGKTSPTERVLNRDIPKLETALVAAEITILKNLVALHPDAARDAIGQLDETGPRDGSAGEGRSIEETPSQFEAAE